MKIKLFQRLKDFIIPEKEPQNYSWDNTPMDKEENKVIKTIEVKN